MGALGFADILGSLFAALTPYQGKQACDGFFLLP